MISFFAITVFAAAGLCSAGAVPRQASITCTFKAYEVQECEPSSTSPTTFLQINEIRSSDQQILVDVRAQRPMNAFNSYQRLNRNEPWDVASLGMENGGSTLVISLNGLNDTMEFVYGAAMWTEDNGVSEAKEGNAGCVVGEWYDVVGPATNWGCSARAREARIASRVSVAGSGK